LDSRGGRQSYFATTQVQRIDGDPKRDDHFYAYVSNCLEFDRAVPFRNRKLYHENGLQRDDGGTNKREFGRAVRSISEVEYDTILKAGFVRTLIEADLSQAERALMTPGFDEATHPFERPMAESVVTRPFREAAFAGSVKSAYTETCAITGLRIINGGGRAEDQAAHIRPVAAGGSGSVRNGVALSGTIQWIFDRGLTSINDDFSVLIAERLLPSLCGA